MLINVTIMILNLSLHTLEALKKKVSLSTPKFSDVSLVLFQKRRGKKRRGKETGG